MKSRLVYVMLLAVIVAAVGSGQAQAATTIHKDNLASPNAAKKFIKQQDIDYMVYVNGSKAMYSKNNGTKWFFTTKTYSVAKNNSGESDDEQDACITSLSGGYNFSATIRANTARPPTCGNDGSGGKNSNSWKTGHVGGMFKVTPPVSDMPLALFLEDIDGKRTTNGQPEGNEQHVYITKNRVSKIYISKSDPYVTSRPLNGSSNDNDVLNNGKGKCGNDAAAGDNPDVTKCNAIVLVTAGGSFNIKAGMKSSRAMITITSNMTEDYRTLTFNANGGTVTDVSNDSLYSHPDGTTKALREYEKGSTPKDFPTPHRSGYTFKGWWDTSAATGGSEYKPGKSALNSNRTVYARWQQNPPPSTWEVEVRSQVAPSKTPSQTNGGPGTYSSNNMTAWPGEYVYFRHGVKKTGTGTALVDRTRLLKTGSATNYTEYGNTVTGSDIGTTEVWYPIDDTTKQYRIPTNATPGDQYCQRYKITPWKSGSTGEKLSTPVCVTVRGWTITPTTNSPTIASGKIRFTHSIRNNGPDSTNKEITFRTRMVRSSIDLSTTTPSGSYAADYSHIWDGSGEKIASGRAMNATFPASTVFTSSNKTSIVRDIINDDIGQYICGWITAVPKNQSQSATANMNDGISSQPKCALIPHDFLLTPTPVVNITNIVEGQTSIPMSSVRGRVANTSGTKSYTNFRYGMSQFVVRKGTAYGTTPGNLPNVVNNWNNCVMPQRHVTGVTLSNCAMAAGYSGTRAAELNTGGSFNFGGGTGDIDLTSLSLSLGDRICWVAYVAKYNKDAGEHDYSYSAPECRTVGKVPKVQFWGADVRSAQEVKTGEPRTIGTGVYGSWAEYAIMSNHGVESASAAKLSSSADGRTGAAIPNEAARNLLTFSNTAPYGNFGSTFVSTIPGTYHTDDATGVGMSGPVNIGTIGDGTHKTTEDLTINGGELMSGRTVIIKSTRTVTITGNITKASGFYANNSDVPQLVISANRIIIDASVTQVDAWLIAKTGPTSYVSTCGSTSGGAQWLQGVTSDTCNQPLIINGPITANHLYLRRTSGSEAGSRHVPAEVLNLRPDTYLWANATARKSQSISTMYTRELPPRF